MLYSVGFGTVLFCKCKSAAENLNTSIGTYNPSILIQFFYPAIVKVGR